MNKMYGKYLYYLIRRSYIRNEFYLYCNNVSMNKQAKKKKKNYKSSYENNKLCKKMWKKL